MANHVENKTILIIAEGENTEPFYFKAIEEIFLKSKEDLKINLTLRIISEIAQPSKKKSHNPKHKTIRKSRQIEDEISGNFVRILMNGQEIEEELSKIEPKYKSQPQRFVRRAQIEMQDNTYNEAWAVFDYDMRNISHIKDAFKIANNDLLGKVKIAYSSIAFEHWILLHYERNLTAFNKSECREIIGKGAKKRKVLLNCCSISDNSPHKDDCGGLKCVGGYLRSMKYYLECSKDDKKIFYTHLDKLSIAFFNASWLRFKMKITEPLTEKSTLDANPFTNVDLMVKQILGELSEFKSICNIVYRWILLDSRVKIKGYLVLVGKLSNNLKVTITNQTNQTQILQESFIEIKNNNIDTIQNLGERTKLDANETVEIDIIIRTGFVFLLIKIESNTTICVELL